MHDDSKDRGKVQKKKQAKKFQICSSLTKSARVSYLWPIQHTVIVIP